MHIFSFYFDGDEVQFTSNINPPSIIPDPASTVSTPMGIVERTQNLFAYINRRVTFSIVERFSYLMGWYHNASLPRLSTAVRSVDVYLTNTNAYMDVARYQTPNTIQIGGFHLREPKNLTEV